MRMKTIRELRLERELTQKELADQAGVTLLSVSNFERGVQEPMAGTLRRIAAVLRVSTDQIALVRRATRRRGPGKGRGRGVASPTLNPGSSSSVGTEGGRADGSTMGGGRNGK